MSEQFRELLDYMSRNAPSDADSISIYSASGALLAHANVNQVPKKKLFADQVIADIVEGKEVSIGVQMSEKKVVVPEGMLKAAVAASRIAACPEDYMTLILEAALRWQRQDVEPKLDAMLRRYLGDDPHDISNMRMNILKLLCEYEPEVPEEIKDLLEVEQPPFANGNYRMRRDESVAAKIIEAYKRGREGK